MAPSLLFIDDFEVQQMIVQMCCLGWNVGLFSDADQREACIDQVYATVAIHVQPPGVERAWKREVRELAELKRELFPWLLQTLPEADLHRGDRHNVLIAGNGANAIEREVVTFPHVGGVLHLVKLLHTMEVDMQMEVERVGKAKRKRGALTDVGATQIANACCAQRADLRSYRKMLEHWQEIQMAEFYQRVTRSALGVVDRIEGRAREVLAILWR
ncbi:hypothetical protein CY658_22210 [Variovorax sp. RO1]|nr:hypothetical protein CY658_22210 [Variovorax sp. RO1]